MAIGLDYIKYVCIIYLEILEFDVKIALKKKIYNNNKYIYEYKYK